jgi:hypothetical protein
MTPQWRSCQEFRLAPPKFSLARRRSRPQSTPAEVPVCSPPTRAVDPVRSPPSPAEGPVRSPPSPTEDPVRSPPSPTEDPVRSPPSPTEDPVRSPPSPTEDPVRSTAHLASPPKIRSEVRLEPRRGSSLKSARPVWSCTQPDEEFMYCCRGPPSHVEVVMP